MGRTMYGKKRILYLCTGNSCRSQMAEAWTRHLRGDEFEIYSAGVAPRGIDPRAVKAMAEVGVDISGQKSKSMDMLGEIEMDYVITLCDNAKETCPYFPARVKLMHRNFDDPPELAQSVKSEEEAMDYYRRIRDEIKDFVMKFTGEMV